MRRAAAIALLLAAACSSATEPGIAPPPGGERIELRSPSLRDGLAIPKRFTCDGANVSPPLRWSGVPEEAAELVLIVKDIDAPEPPFYHWAVAGISPLAERVEQGAIPGAEVNNSFGRTSYGGPCPPSGVHRYFFSLYAVREPIDSTGLTAAELETRATQLALAFGEISGTYERA